MQARVIEIFLLAAFVSGAEYESGSTKVDVSIEYLDDFGSNVKCVDFLSNAPERYNKACFTSTYTDGGTFFDCDVKFGDETCTRCAPCETQDEKVGYEVDCFNAQPKENTRMCVELTDRNIQEILVDEVFSVDFAFNDNITSSDSGDGASQNRSSSVAQYSTLFVSLLVAALSFQ